MKYNSLKDFSQQELKLLSKSPESNAFKYKKWFVTNAEHFKTIDEEYSEVTSKKYHCEIKQCYINIWRLVTSDIRAQYYEGFVYSKDVPLPIEHCWAVINGKVIDPTLTIRVKDLKYKRRLGDEYYGIKIPKGFVTRQGLQSGKSGPYLIDYYLSKRGAKHG